MKYNIKYKDGAICLPSEAFLKCEGINEIKLLMLLSYDRALCDGDDIMLAEQLGITQSEFEEAVASLKDKGLLEKEKLAPSSTSKNMSGEEISKVLSQSSPLKTLIDECQTMCGKVFTPTDISKLLSLNTVLGLDADTIYMLFLYQSQKLEAVGKKVSVSYVEKSAYSLYNQGIRNIEQLQLYINQTEKKNSIKYKLSKLFGMGDRAFTKKEKTFFDKWLVEWEMPFELVQGAFEIAVDNTGKPSLEYMSKILSDWYSSGIKTVEGAEKANAEFKATQKSKAKFKEKTDVSNGESFNTEEFFDKALKRSMAIMNASQNNGKAEQ